MRKNLVLLNLLVVFSMLLAACGAETPVPTEAPTEEAPATATPTPSRWQESPMLADRGEAGELPPVDERVPENPMVIAPLGETGVYGGELVFGFPGADAGAAGWGGMLYLMGWEHLMTWKPDFSGVEPNLVESVEASEDVTTYTFHMREGMKWSDGEPFTADDILFYIEDVALDPDIKAGLPGDLIPAAMQTGFQAVKVDDYTFQFIFPEPYGTLPYMLATWAGRYFGMYPKHYLMQFHKKYNPDVDTLVAEDGTVQDWVALFLKKSPHVWGDPTMCLQSVDLPTLGAWILTEPIASGNTLLVERNPYYWKVDTEGNQLPYIDTILGVGFQDANTMFLAELNGEIDTFKDASDDQRQMFYDAVLLEDRPIRIVEIVPDGGNRAGIYFNMAAKDPFKREIYQNKDFRIGLSYAINRQELIDALFLGRGDPAQIAPLEDSPLYNEQLATQYIEYDPALATEYLDKVFTWGKDDEGFYLNADGERFTVVMSVQNDFAQATWAVQMAEYVKTYWAAVGVDMTLDSVTASVYDNERRRLNDLEASIGLALDGGGGITAILSPVHHTTNMWHSAMGYGWPGHGADAEYEIPYPDWAQYPNDLYLQAIQQPTQEGQIAKMQELMQYSADTFWGIGIARQASAYTVMSARMMNANDFYGGWIQGFYRIARPEQWWLQP